MTEEQKQVLQMLQNKCSSGYINSKIGWTKHHILKFAKENNINITETMETYSRAKKLINQGCDEFDICYELGITLDYVRYIANNIAKHKFRSSRANRGKVYESSKGDARAYMTWVGPLPELTEEDKEEARISTLIHYNGIKEQKNTYYKTNE